MIDSEYYIVRHLGQSKTSIKRVTWERSMLHPIVNSKDDHAKFKWSKREEVGRNGRPGRVLSYLCTESFVGTLLLGSLVD